MGYQIVFSVVALSVSVATAHAAPMLLASTARSDGAVLLEQQENHLTLVLHEDVCSRVGNNDNNGDNGAGQSLFLHGIRAESAPGTIYKIYLEVAPDKVQGKSARVKVGELNFYGQVPGVGRNMSFFISSKIVRAALLQTACEIKLVIIPNKPVAKGSHPSIDYVELWMLSPSPTFAR
jgi:hypothetical protein